MKNIQLTRLITGKIVLKAGSWQITCRAGILKAYNPTTKQTSFNHVSLKRLLAEIGV